LALYSNYWLFNSIALVNTLSKKVIITAIYNNDNNKSLILINAKELKTTELIKEAYKHLKASAIIRRG
jgi:hypothetical protein